MADVKRKGDQSANPPISLRREGEWLAVDILTFRSTTRDIQFDVFLKLSEGNFAHIFSRTTGLDYKRLAQYIQKAVKELYIRPEDEEAFRQFAEKSAHSVFQDPETPVEKKIATLLNMTEQNMAEIFFQMKVPDTTAQSTIRVIKNYVELMTENPKTLAVLLKLVSHGEYLYYHSIATSIFSMFIAKASGQFNTRMLELVGMGGFLHDIGCTKLPKEVVCSPTDLSAEQWVDMHTHTKLGLTMIEETPNIPDEVRYIVYQHHEEPGGQGYPNGLRSPVIFYPAKIVAIADSFSALISKRPFRPAYSPEEAIEVMKKQAGKYDRDLVQLLTTLFGRSNSGTQAA
jgi:putative nucleotidyltransferase with HDIG domain